MQEFLVFNAGKKLFYIMIFFLFLVVHCFFYFLLLSTPLVLVEEVSLDSPVVSDLFLSGGDDEGSSDFWDLFSVESFFVFTGCFLFGVGLYFGFSYLGPFVFSSISSSPLDSVFSESSSQLSEISTVNAELVLPTVQELVAPVEPLVSSVEPQLASAFVLGALAVGAVQEMMTFPILHSPSVHQFLSVVFSSVTVCSQERMLLSYFLSRSSERAVLEARELARDLAGLADRLGVVGTPEQVLLLCLRYPGNPTVVASRFSWQELLRFHELSR